MLTFVEFVYSTAGVMLPRGCGGMYVPVVMNETGMEIRENLGVLKLRPNVMFILREEGLSCLSLGRWLCCFRQDETEEQDRSLGFDFLKYWRRSL